MKPVLPEKFHVVFIVLKQFGTGVVLCTAFIHLFTHADLMFGNSCLGELKYEGTTAAIFLAGLFLSFLIDYLGARFVAWRQARNAQLVLMEESGLARVEDPAGGGMAI